MLHLFPENRPASSEEDFQRVYTIYGRGSHLGLVTSIISIYVNFHVPKSLHTKFD